MSNASVSMAKIAKLAGVSQPTVSYVLNGQWRAKRISPGMAAKVRRIGREQNYRPNRLIHALQTGRSHTLAAIFPTVKGEYFPRIAAGIEHEAKRHGYHLLISQVERGLEDEAGEIEVLLERRVDGLILVPRYGKGNRENYCRLIAQGIPLVFVDAYIPDVPCPAVVGADEEGMCAVTRHLIALGHRRIAFVDDAMYLEMTHMQDRRQGFLRAMAEHGIEVPDAYMSNVAEGASASVHKGLQLVPRPTALVAATDYHAVFALIAAEAMGMRVPDDIAVTGFSDCLENVNLYRVPLTSVRMDLEEMGRRAMQRLLREIEKISKRNDLTHIPANLIVRASSGGMKKINPVKIP